MRLLDLSPRWCRFGDAPEGAKQGVTFLCPHCRITRLGVFFDVPICGSPAVDTKAYQEAHDCDHPLHQPELHQDTHMGAKLWHREGDSFENLTLTPSIDASAWGCWHGCITNGEVE